MQENIASAVLAAEERSAGGLGLLVVLGMLVLSVGIFYMMSKSLRRMRENVASGAFRGVDSERTGPVDPRQALRRRSTFLGGGKAAVIDGEIIAGTPGGRTVGDGRDAANLPAQPGPPAGG